MGATDFNVFTHFFNNWIFLFVLAVVFCVQWSASHAGGFNLTWMFETAEIDHQVFWTTFFWGSTSLVVAALLKLSPQAWLEKMPIKIDENKALGADSKLVSLYDKATNAQVVANSNDDDFKPPADNSDE